jgi:hypothetical protein
MLIDIGFSEIQTDLYEIDTQMSVYGQLHDATRGLPVGRNEKSINDVYPLAIGGETHAGSDIMPSIIQEAPCHA